MRPDGTRTDFVQRNRQGRRMAVLEAWRASTYPFKAQDLDRHNIEEFGLSFALRSNGGEAQFCDRQSDARAGEIAGFDAQDDLESSVAAPRSGAPALSTASRRAWAREPARPATFARDCQPRCRARPSKGARALTAPQPVWRRGVIAAMNDNGMKILSTSIAPMERPSMEPPPMPQPQP